ncbi:MAG: FlgD immunoglobulin-like domain containing protein [Bacteroidota bacterium]
MRKISILIACFGFAILHGQTSNVTLQTVSNYRGWKWDTTIVMQNGLITMATVPAIGGRVMQYDLGSLPSIMVDSSLFGKTYTPTFGGFHNFGGYKTWPSPQNVWPGTWPPPPTLDYGAYTVLDMSPTDDSVTLSILSPIEKWSAPNIQFKRRATIYPGTSRVRMEQTIINNGSASVSWGVWSIVQTIVNHPNKTDTLNYWAYFPINPKSVYGSSGVKPDYASTAWKGEIAPGVFGVQFVAENKKIFADPDKRWIVYTSLSDTVVFARTFSLFDGMQYPDNGARVTVYVSSKSPPWYMEVEVKGPVVVLAANGGNYTFTENWWAAKVRAPVLDVDSVGAIAKRLSYNSTTQSVSAIYGVFYQGTAKVAFVDAQGQLLTEGPPHTVSPLSEFQLQETVTIPSGAKTAKVQIYNTKNELIGVLESTDVSGFSTAVEATTPVLATEYRLSQNFPNPFNPSTTIAYDLPVKSLVKVIIYNLQGREIKLFTFTAQFAGHHKIVWDGTDYQVNPLSSGMYVYRILATSREDGKIFDKSAKMILLK